MQLVIEATAPGGHSCLPPISVGGRPTPNTQVREGTSGIAHLRLAIALEIRATRQTEPTHLHTGLTTDPDKPSGVENTSRPKTHQTPVAGATGV